MAYFDGDANHDNKTQIQPISIVDKPIIDISYDDDPKQSKANG
jgi:hypothetical protein